MKILLRTWLFLVLACAASFAGTEDKEVHNVSVIRLIAAPQGYAQKGAHVVGFLNIGFEGDAAEYTG